MLESYKIKAVEHIELVPLKERVRALKEAFYNPYLLPANKVYIDLLSDSGTSALSNRQQASLLEPDESFSFQNSYYEFVKAVESIFGFSYVYPIHQGRMGEHILFKIKVKKGDYIPSNTHYATTKANIEHWGAKAVDFVIEEAYHPEVFHPFKGNIDIDRVSSFVREREKIPLAFLTITNNTCGDQPVSLENIRQYKQTLSKRNIPLYYDACRFAENAYFIKQRERKYSEYSIEQIVKKMFSCADGCILSAKKDGLSHIGGFFATRSAKLANEFENLILLMEGYHTHGGLTGRDLKIITIGLSETLSEKYLEFRTGQIQYLWKKLNDAGIPLYSPAGGNAVFVDVSKFLPHLRGEEYPTVALADELYRKGGIRAGGFQSEALQLLRLSIPRRVYTNSHIDYVAEVLKEVYEHRENITGLEIVYRPPYLEHYTARFKKR